MKNFEYMTEEKSDIPPCDWELDWSGEWELVAILPYKHNKRKYYRMYYKKEVTG